MSESELIRVAVDVMSGDDGPRLRLSAIVKALNSRSDLCFMLVGDQQVIRSHLSDLAGVDWSRLSIVHTSAVVAMDDPPAKALRSKQNSSMWQALDLVAQGEAQACVSAGNTGALMVMSRFLLKTFSGVDRPAIAVRVPCQKGAAILLDVGANVGCSSTHLYQFAVMGVQLAQCTLLTQNPKVALLNTGVEGIKGTEQVRMANKLLLADKQINYVGYIEGDAIFAGGIDVLVADGFVGNVALKTAEGVAAMVRQRFLSVFHGSKWKRLLGSVFSPALSSFARQIDPALYNGASFLGLPAVVVKSHGKADAVGFYQALCQAIEEVESDLPDKLATGIEAMLETE